MCLPIRLAGVYISEYVVGMILVNKASSLYQRLAFHFRQAARFIDENKPHKTRQEVIQRSTRLSLTVIRGPQQENKRTSSPKQTGRCFGVISSYSDVSPLQLSLCVLTSQVVCCRCVWWAPCTMNTTLRQLVCMTVGLILHLSCAEDITISKYN